MRPWSVCESRVTAAATRGWLRCAGSRGSCCGLHAVKFPLPLKADLEHRMADTSGVKRVQSLSSTATSRQQRPSQVLARLYPGTEVLRRNCAGRMPSSVTAQCRMLHCTAHTRKYFDDDFAAPASEAGAGISSKRQKDELGRLSRRTKALGHDGKKNAQMSADTLRSIAFAKHVLRGDRGPGALSDEPATSLGAAPQHDSLCPPRDGEVDSPQPHAAASSLSSSPNARNESLASDSSASQRHERVSTPEDFTTNRVTVDEIRPSFVNNFSTTHSDPSFSPQCSEPTVFLGPDSTRPSVNDDFHYSSNPFPEQTQSSLSFNQTETSNECDVRNHSSSFITHNSFPSHETTSISQEHISSTPSEDSDVSTSSWESSSSSSYSPEEDSLPHLSNSHASSTPSPNSSARSLLPAHTEHIAAAACTVEDLTSVLRETVISPPHSRLLKVAVLGLPNAGKSSLVNALTQNQVCIASRKVHTTRSVGRAAVTLGRTQLVFLDTPGVVTPEATQKHKLPQSLVRGSEEAMAEADLLLMVVDAATRYAKLGLHPRLMRMLVQHPNTPALLCINKVDLVQKKSSLLDLAKEFTEGKVGGVTSHTDSRFVSPKVREPFTSRNKTHQELVDEFLDNLEHKKKRENAHKALPANENLMLPSSEASNSEMLKNDDDCALTYLEKPVPSEDLSSLKKQEEKMAAEQKPFETLIQELYESDASSTTNVLPTTVSSEEDMKVDQAENFSSNTADRTTSALSTDVDATRVASSIMPLLEAAKLEYCVSFEELKSNNYLYVAPRLGSALEASRPPLPFTEEEVLQGRVQLSEDQARDFVKDRKGWPLFQEVVFTSTNSERGINPLRDLLLRRAKPAAWVYPPSLSTDQDPRQLAVATVRAKFMDRLKFQVPYELQYAVERWELGGGDLLHIGVCITCSKDRVAKMVVGTRGCNVVCAAKDAEDELTKVFKKDIHLRLRVTSDESERRAEDIAKERKLIEAGSSHEEAQLLVKGMPPDKVKRHAGILKEKGAVFHRSVGGLVFKREHEN